MRCPTGKSVCRHPDSVTAFLNDPGNYVLLSSWRPGLDPSTVLGNEIPQYLAPVANFFFGAYAQFQWVHEPGAIAAQVQAGKAVIFNRKDIGHFICLTAWDAANQQFIYVDPDPHLHQGSDNWYEARMSVAEFTTWANSFTIVVAA